MAVLSLLDLEGMHFGLLPARDDDHHPVGTRLGLQGVVPLRVERHCHAWPGGALGLSKWTSPLDTGFPLLVTVPETVASAPGGVEPKGFAAPSHPQATRVVVANSLDRRRVVFLTVLISPLVERPGPTTRRPDRVDVDRPFVGPKARPADKAGTTDKAIRPGEDPSTRTSL